jgi:hypothetical protein
MDRLTTTIKRQFLAEIVAGTKTTEYRDIKPYWTNRLGNVRVPFELRLINGMRADAPEVTVVIDRVRKNTRSGSYGLHIADVLSVKHWNRRTRRPA